MTENTRTILAAALAADKTIAKSDADAILERFDESRVIRTREACRVFGVTARTLRNWADAGMLVPVRGANPNQRIGYTAESVRLLLAGRTSSSAAATV